RIIHEVGCVRMGRDKNTSVVNGDCQAHDVKNLFVADGGPFVTNADKNVTWTILALSMRTSERIADAKKRMALSARSLGAPRSRRSGRHPSTPRCRARRPRRG